MQLVVVLATSNMHFVPIIVNNKHNLHYLHTLSYNIMHIIHMKEVIMVFVVEYLAVLNPYGPLKTSKCGQISNKHTAGQKC